MIPLATFRELYDFNYWARDRQLEACRSLTEKQFLQSTTGSFSSLRDTLAHMVGREVYWLERWRGSSAEQILAVFECSSRDHFLKQWPARFACLRDIETRWKGVEFEIRTFISSISSDSLSERLTYKTNDGVIETYELWRMLFKLIEHQSYHRGQVTILLRQLGAKPAGVDFLNGYHASRGAH